MLHALTVLADQAAEQPNPLMAFAPMILILIALYFIVLRPAQKREKMQREQLLANMKKNDKVLTSGGIIGVIALVNDKEDEVILKVDESSNVRLRVLRSSIIKNYTSEEAAAKERELAGKGDKKSEAITVKS